MTSITNAHTHLELTGLSRLCPTEPGNLVPWMNRVVRAMKSMTTARIQDGVVLGARELKACGTTHIVDVSASWQSLELLQDSGLAGAVCLEVRGLNRKQALQKLEKAKSVILNFRHHNQSAPIQAGLSLHAPYTCHPELLKKGADWCRRENIPLCIHVSESPAETRLIQRAVVLARTGRVGEIARLAAILRPFIPKWHSVSYLHSLGVLEARPILAHCIHLTDAEIRLIADSGCSVVHCPRSNERLACGRMPLERFLAAGIPVFLGTDSRASSPDLDIHREAGYAKRIHSGLVNPDKIDKMLHQPLLWPVE
jgi:cytosine/adenosine deaminase-related metal-dependent hydrolase